RETGRGGGTLIYVKQPICATHFSHPILSQLNDSVWVEIKVLRSKPILIGCVYRPPSSNREYDNVLSNIFSVASNLPFSYNIIGGDFNLPDISWRTLRGPSRYDNLLNSIITGGWTQHINVPTRSNNILDLIFTINVAPSTIHVGHEFPGSDHKIVACSFNISPETIHRNEVSRTPIRLYTQVDWDLYQDLIRYSNWDSYFTNDSLEEVLENFYDNIQSINDVIAPVKLIKFKIPQGDFIPISLRRSLRKHSLSYYRHDDLSSLIAIKTILIRIHELKNLSLRNKETRAIQSPHNTGEIAKLFKKTTDSVHLDRFYVL
uniref:Endonuclease/exonuclease/phosphatase domain-containing protein n=1 Tax=Trichobilharzia regenti TaxID=157069 RepID=A0AA85J6K1_TRIRE